VFDVTEGGRALVFTTHEPDVAERCDRVLTLTRPSA
jgi:predicted ABC-type transport system involved in lysophospholipase L1 biosynthesis ATPase subunit